MSDPYQPQPNPYGNPYPQQPNPQQQPNPYDPNPYTPNAYGPGPSHPYAPVPYGYPPVPSHLQKSKLAAGLLAIFLGTLGVHNFYLGKTGLALTQLLISVLTLGMAAPVIGIWALIEGILILTGSQSYRTDARGIPLRD